MLHLALVFVGAGCGGVARYLLATAAQARYGPALTGLPVGTLVVNLLGSTAIGAVAALWGGHQWVRLLVIAGFLGGFTTFSTFSRETVELVEAGRPGAAALSAGASLTGCLLGAWGGFLGGRLLGGPG